MFWETVAAMLLLLGILPFWLFISVAWGSIGAVLSLVGASGPLLDGSSLDAGQFLAIPAGAVTEGFSAAWGVPAAIWTWAKYDHPWWAVILGLAMLGFGGSSSR